MGERVDAIISSFAAALAQEAEQRFINLVEDLGLKSPIEKMMASGLMLLLESSGHFGGPGTCNIIFPADIPGTFEKCNRDFGAQYDNGIEISCQLPIGKYTADFFVNFRHWKGIRVIGVIECDGHEFHERTKAQAAHDKARDRYFQSLGLIVLRYTGSEIFRDPEQVAIDALTIFSTRANALAGEDWEGVAA